MDEVLLLGVSLVLGDCILSLLGNNLVKIAFGLIAHLGISHLAIYIFIELLINRFWYRLPIFILAVKQH